MGCAWDNPAEFFAGDEERLELKFGSKTLAALRFNPGKYSATLGPAGRQPDVTLGVMVVESGFAGSPPKTDDLLTANGVSYAVKFTILDSAANVRYLELGDPNS